MAGSRLAAQYQAFAVLDQFQVASEDVSYVPKSGGNAVTLKGVVNREENPVNEQRGESVFEIQRAVLTVLALADAVFGGVTLNTADAVRDFKGINFSVSLCEGGPLVSGWMVRNVTGGPGTWDLTLVRETRVETGKTRRDGK